MEHQCVAQLERETTDLSMKPVLRFAPSPTGRLHIGNVRTATLNWLFALKHAGTFVLRLDDTDLERSSEAFAEGIRDDLDWLGLKWAREERQSLRTARYEAAAAKLKAAGVLYPCYESEDELDRKRKRQLALHKPPIYDRSALKLSEAEREKSKPRDASRTGGSACPIRPPSTDLLRSRPSSPGMISFAATRPSIWDRFRTRS